MRYVVGYDGSSPSEAALAWTIQLAHGTSAPIVLVHVAEGDEGNMGSAYEMDDVRSGAAVLSRRLGELQRSEPELEASGVALTGNVTWELSHAVDASDLLVIGTHKTGFLHGRVLGSRSVQIAASAVCCVAVIPEVDLRFRTGVVAGIDRELSAMAVAELAADAAADRGEELALIESVPSGTPVQDPMPLTVALAAARRRQPKIVIRSRTSSRAPAEALLDAARGKTLLVLGPGSDSPDRSPIGSVLHDVLLNVTAPVLIVRSLGALEER